MLDYTMMYPICIRRYLQYNIKLRCIILNSCFELTRGLAVNKPTSTPQTNETSFYMAWHSSGSSEAWWLSGTFGAFHPEGCRFEFHSSRPVGTLGKSFTHLLVALRCVNSDKA